MKNVTPRFDELIRDTKAWLEYASEAGLVFTSFVQEEAAGEDFGPAPCKTCPLGSERQGVSVPWGGTRPQVVFVSAAPLSGCKDGGSPFVGEAGAQLEKIINATKSEARLGDDDIVLTYARKCSLASGSEIPSEVLKRAFTACAPVLREEILALNPSVVIAMGAEALRALTGVEDIKAARGRLHDLAGAADSGLKVQPTYGLQELMGNNKLRRPVWDDILLAIKALKR